MKNALVPFQHWPLVNACVCGTLTKNDKILGMNFASRAFSREINTQLQTAFDFRCSFPSKLSLSHIRLQPLGSHKEMLAPFSEVISPFNTVCSLLDKQHELYLPRHAARCVLWSALTCSDYARQYRRLFDSSSCHTDLWTQRNEFGVYFVPPSTPLLTRREQML